MPPSADRPGPRAEHETLRALVDYLDPARRETAPDAIEAVIDGVVARHAPSTDGNLSGFLYDLGDSLGRSKKLANRRTSVRGAPPGQPWGYAEGDPRDLIAVEVDAADEVESLHDLAHALRELWAGLRYAYFDATSLRWYREATVLRFVTVIGHDDFFVSGTITAAGPAHPRLAADFARRLGPLPRMGAPLEDDVDRWARGLGRFGREAVERAGVAAARLAHPLWQAELPADERPLRAIQAHEAWILCPCDVHAAALDDARRFAGLAGGAASHPGASDTARAAALCCLRDGQVKRAAALTSAERVREAIRSELLPWALGERDPLRARVDARA